MPQVNRIIRFKIVAGSGSLSLSPAPGVVKELDVPTQDEGIARCFWTLDSTTQTQTVKASLIDSGCGLVSPLYYTAEIETATANTGLVKLFDYEKGGIYGPFRHFIQANVPPAIILAYAGTEPRRDRAGTKTPIIYTEDWGLYQNFQPVDKELWTVQFKPVRINNENFSIQFFDPTLPAPPPNYLIRWWAIPAQEQPVQNNERAG